MRIIAGRWKGRRLVSFKAPHIRPTTDRVKEVLFNKIQFDVDGSCVLDLFAGTGSLSFEALSRGAKKVVSVEAHPKSLSIIEKNKNMLGDVVGLKVVRSDVLKFLKKNSLHNFDLIIIDPPFTKAMSHEVLEFLAGREPFSPDVRIFIESASSEAVQNDYGSLKLFQEIAFGDKYLREFRPQS